jgi:hypothetical protein
MDATEEIIVYDAMAALQENSATLAALVNRCGTDREKKAYKSGVYAACIKLQCVLGIEAMKNGSERHRRKPISLTPAMSDAPGTNVARRISHEETKDIGADAEGAFAPCRC